MTIENDILNQISKKFPLKAQEIAKKYSENEGFREICEDYLLCLKSIGEIELMDTRKKVYLEEFKNALLDLEYELLSYLQTNKMIKKCSNCEKQFETSQHWFQLYL